MMYVNHTSCTARDTELPLQLLLFDYISLLLQMGIDCRLYCVLLYNNPSLWTLVHCMDSTINFKPMCTQQQLEF